MKKSPLSVGDIVTMNIHPGFPTTKTNVGRLMRVTKVKYVGAGSETGHLVNVKVNVNPIKDLDNNDVFELLEFDCNWFTKYEEK